MEFRYKHWCGRAERGRTRAQPCRRYSGGSRTRTRPCFIKKCTKTRTGLRLYTLINYWSVGPVRSAFYRVPVILYRPDHNNNCQDRFCRDKPSLLRHVLQESSYCTTRIIIHVIMHEIETWAPGSAAHALCVINIRRGARPAGAGGGPGPIGPPLDPPQSPDAFYRLPRHLHLCGVDLEVEGVRYNYRDASRACHLRTGPASFKGQRSRTRRRCRVRVRVPRLPRARYRVMAS